jgi:hypothetical protein
MNQQHHTNERPLSPEDILIALDQLDQTLEVMAAVIKRLKRNLQHVLPPAPDYTDPLDIPLPDSGWH